jgi:hypothetical protein
LMMRSVVSSWMNCINTLPILTCLRNETGKWARKRRDEGAQSRKKNAAPASLSRGMQSNSESILSDECSFRLGLPCFSGRSSHGERI